MALCSLRAVRSRNSAYKLIDMIVQDRSDTHMALITEKAAVLCFSLRTSAVGTPVGHPVGAPTAVTAHFQTYGVAYAVETYAVGPTVTEFTSLHICVQTHVC